MLKLVNEEAMAGFGGYHRPAVGHDKLKKKLARQGLKNYFESSCCFTAKFKNKGFQSMCSSGHDIWSRDMDTQQIFCHFTRVIHTYNYISK